MKKVLFIGLAVILSWTNVMGQVKNEKETFTESFNLEECTFQTIGRNQYFILEPGYQLNLAGMEGKDSVELKIFVSNETKLVGDIETRVVIEFESVNGHTVEISRNYFAFCKETASIYYFGEDVDIYKDGKVVSHSGAWLATGDNKPGLIMPGTPLLGARYYQEIAPGIAMDRAEIISLSETFFCEAGDFTHVMSTLETTPLEPKDKSVKLYAPGIGLIKDDNLTLVVSFFVK